MATALDIPMARLRDMAYRSGASVGSAVANGRRGRGHAQEHDGVRTQAPNLVLDSPTRILRRRLMGSPQAVRKVRDAAAARGSKEHRYERKAASMLNKQRQFYLPWSPEHPSNLATRRETSKYADVESDSSSSFSPLRRLANKNPSPGHMYAVKIHQVRRSLQEARDGFRASGSDEEEEEYKGPAEWPLARNHHHHESMYDRAIAISGAAGDKKKRSVHEAWLQRSRRAEQDAYEALYEQQREIHHDYRNINANHSSSSNNASRDNSVTGVIQAGLTTAKHDVSAEALLSPTKKKRTTQRQQQQQEPSSSSSMTAVMDAGYIAMASPTSPEAPSSTAPAPASPSSSSSSSSTEFQRHDRKVQGSEEDDTVADALAMLQWNLRHSKQALRSSPARLSSASSTRSEELQATLRSCEEAVQQALALQSRRREQFKSSSSSSSVRVRKPPKSVRKRVKFAMKANALDEAYSSSDSQ